MQNVVAGGLVPEGGIANYACLGKPRRHADYSCLDPQLGKEVWYQGVRPILLVAPLDQGGDLLVIWRLDPFSIFGTQKPIIQIADDFLECIGVPTQVFEKATVLKDCLDEIANEQDQLLCAFVSPLWLLVPLPR